MADDAPLYDSSGAVAALIQLREQSHPQLSHAEKVEAAAKLIANFFETAQHRGFRVTQPDPRQTKWLLAIAPNKQAHIELTGYDILVGVAGGSLRPVPLNYDAVARRFTGPSSASGRESSSGPHGLADAIVDAVMGSVTTLSPPPP